MPQSHKAHVVEVELQKQINLVINLRFSSIKIQQLIEVIIGPSITFRQVACGGRMVPPPTVPISTEGIVQDI